MYNVEKALFLRRRVRGIFRLKDVAIDLQLQRVLGEAQEPYACGGVLHFRIFDQEILNLPEHIADMIRRKIVAQANRLLAQEFVAEAQVLDDGRCHRAIRDGKQGALAGPQPGGSQADVLDYSRLIVDAAGVADLDDLVKNNQNPPKQVFKSLLPPQPQPTAP